jgi:hypothetical protein
VNSGHLDAKIHGEEIPFAPGRQLAVKQANSQKGLPSWRYLYPTWLAACTDGRIQVCTEFDLTHSTIRHQAQQHQEYGMPATPFTG